MNTDTCKKVIEVNGVKLEVDLRKATVISNYKVGDTVKILIKHYDKYKSHVGVIVGFDDFKELPTLIVAYLDTSYSEADVKTVYYNSKSEDVEIIKASEHELNFDYTSASDLLQKDIEKKHGALQEARNKLAYFEKYFDRRFNQFVNKEEKSV